MNKPEKTKPKNNSGFGVVGVFLVGAIISLIMGYILLAVIVNPNVIMLITKGSIDDKRAVFIFLVLAPLAGGTLLTILSAK